MSLKVVRFFHKNGKKTVVEHRVAGEDDKNGNPGRPKGFQLENDKEIIGIFGKTFDTYATKRLAEFGFITSSYKRVKTE